MPEGDQVWREIARGANLELPAGAAMNAATVHEIARDQCHVLGSFTVERLRSLASVMANNVRLLRQARLEVLDGDITLFGAARATAGLDRTHADPNAWRAFCSGTVEIVTVDAEHHQMLSPEAVRQMRVAP